MSVLLLTGPRWCKVRQKVNCQTSHLSLSAFSKSKKRRLRQADDDHAVWKLYRLLNGPSGHESYAVQERCKLSIQVKKQTVHQKTGDMRISSE